MSYSDGLGVGVPTPTSGPGAATTAPSPTSTSRPTPAPLPNLTRPFNLVPAECASVGHDYTPPPATIPANKPLVTSFVRVRFSGSSAIQSLLDQISPKALETTRSTTGSRSSVATAKPLNLADRIGSLFLSGLGSTGGIQIPDTVIGWLADWPHLGNPSYIGAGWIPDTESIQTWTRGVLWVAVGLEQPIVMATLRRSIVDLVQRAQQASGAAVTIDLVGTTPAMAASMGDDDVLAAAYKSAIGISQFGAFISTTFGNATVTAGIHSIANPINRAAQRVREGFEVYRNLSVIETAVDAQITTALASQPPVAGIPILQNARAGVTAARKKVEDALRDAPGVIQAASVADTQLKQALQQTILASVNQRIQQPVPFSLAREYVRCGTLTMAQRSLTNVESQLSQALSTSVPAAQAVVAEREDIVASFPTFDRMLTKIARAEEDLPRPWFSRRLGPLPVWAWIAAGGATVVGGAVGVRVLRKKKALTPNRRRRA